MNERIFTFNDYPPKGKGRLTAVDITLIAGKPGKRADLGMRLSLERTPREKRMHDVKILEVVKPRTIDDIILAQPLIAKIGSKIINYEGGTFKKMYLVTVNI